MTEISRSQRRIGTRRCRSVGLLLLSLAAVVAPAKPAAAAETIQGSGAGTGYSTIDVRRDPEFPLCLPGSSGSQYFIDAADGIVVAAETMPDKTATYVGPLEVTITLTESFFFSPAGTFQDSMCIIPKAVPATIAVTGENGLDEVTCPADDGVFTRTDTIIEFNESSDGAALDGSCTVVDNGVSVTVSPVTHAFAGNEYPCYEDPITLTYTCPNGIDEVHVQGDWTVTGADPSN